MFNDFEDRILKPTLDDKLTIFSDGNDDYTFVLPEYFGKECINYGQKIKTKNGEKIFPAIKRIVYGKPAIEDIETNTVESINSVLRGKLSKLHRKTKMISKNRFSLNSAIWLFKFAWNFIHKRHNHLLTPAMIEGLSTKFWSWGMFLHTKISYTN